MRLDEIRDEVHVYRLTRDIPYKVVSRSIFEDGSMSEAFLRGGSRPIKKGEYLGLIEERTVTVGDMSSTTKLLVLRPTFGSATRAIELPMSSQCAELVVSFLENEREIRIKDIA